MKNQQDLEKLFDSLVSITNKAREAFMDDKTNQNLILKLRKQILELIGFFLDFKEDKELQYKLNIYSHVAKFIQEKIALDNDNFSVCLSAALFLCNEIDRKIYIENKPSNQTQNIIAAAKEQLIAIKIHYNRDREASFCNQKTEIFSLLSGKDKPTVTKIEELNIDLSDLPEEIYSLFIKDKQDNISFQIYP